jgi:hypothetical protein
MELTVDESPSPTMDPVAQPHQAVAQPHQAVLTMDPVA